MEQLRGAIESVIRQLSERKPKYSDARPEEWLKKSLTRKELGHIKFHYFRSGILGVKVDSSVWKYNFALQQEALLQKIHKYAPQVRALRFSVGEVK